MASSGSAQKSEEEWRAVLSPEQFRILRQKGTESGTHTDMRFKNGTADRSNRMKPPPSAFESNQFVQNRNSSHEEAQRPHRSPPTSQWMSPVDFANSPSHQSFHPVKSYSDFNSAKRARSPPSPSAYVSSVQLDSDREMIAKAKRLARFNVELSRSVENLDDVSKRHKASGTKRHQAALDKRNADDPAYDSMDLVVGGIFSDYEGLESSAVVVGLCPDMCPESEREERGRKGDLDKYERLDGDRNQTSKLIAVKKYNRTAEREADLIRPMPVLQKTVDYLLHLLDQPYNDSFLSIYNFLWDRMRAIRMDLRMQHIFNREAIIMLEQMIRLHIIAMHELCEYQKGEGFSEGFDAHLNIEQMNKTSVELFQMYDDHRKQSNNVPTEKEFRGYYALLKLDKHPGYKVEPAELSLDLAKMTSEIRSTPEILFARDVARACRIGNYIAFFRLARKATYLEACLMHAHFAKLRTQALASLHSGLQNNQGIPVPHVVQWLGMEGEDIESLLEYHGFAVKKYEEIYMMKEGPFLNIDADFPTKCSQLVHSKKSRKIFDDVNSGRTLLGLAEEKEIVPAVVDMVDPRSKTSWFNTVDEEMLDHKVDSVLRVMTPTKQPLEGATPTIMLRENDTVITEGSLSRATCISLDDSRSNNVQQVEDGQVYKSDWDIFMDERNLPEFEVNEVRVPGGLHSECMIMNFDPQAVVGNTPDTKAMMPALHDQDEAASEKLKLILRKWKQQASIRKEIREQREYLANEALSSLSVGPPIRRNKAYPKHVTGVLNIDHVLRVRAERHAKSWSSVNVSELVAPVLSARNPDARCICWKVVVVVQSDGTENQTDQLASRWLLSKLKGKRSDDGLVVSLSHASIWSKWADTHIGDPQTWCLSVVREAMLDDNQPVAEDDVIAGTSSIVFLVSETVPWEIQRVRLNNLLTSVPPGSNLPLLVVSSGPSKEEIADPSVAIINRLGLHDADRTKLNAFSVVFLADDLNVFFDDDRLREGLKWLANHSPVQPSVHMVSTHELVLSYLRYSTDVLNNLDSSDVGPEHCISVFNEALDRLAAEIIEAALLNPNHWPCPEIYLIERLSSERIRADMSLPSTGWSSAARIDPLVRAIKGCKLPSFPSNTSWLNQGCHGSDQIQSQKLAIEDCLFRYLTQSSGLLNVDLAPWETNVMLQQGAGLELRDSCYHIVMRWQVIFRRIYNWRLRKLAVREFSVAYVLDGVVPLERNQPCYTPVRTQVTLDEMIECCCRVPLAPQQLPSANRPIGWTPEIDHEGSHSTEIDITSLGESDEDPGSGGSSAGDVSTPVERNDRLVAPLTEKKDRLAMLLQECKRNQDMIAEKLSYYF